MQPSQGAAGSCAADAESAAGPPALTVRECCASLDFWLLFVVFGVGTGLGLMFVNNLGKLHGPAQLHIPWQPHLAVTHTAVPSHEH